jgi:hypothetical protein
MRGYRSLETTRLIMKTKLFSPRTWSPLARVVVPVLFVLAVCVVVIGLNSVTGLALGLTAVTILILVLVRRWRRIRNFIYLAVGAFLGAVVLSGIYMEIARPLAVRIGGEGALESTPWNIFQGFVSDGIMLIAGSAIIIGVFGAIILALARAWGELRHRSAS